MFLGQEKHRGMYSIPEILALAAMTTDEQYKARQAELDCHDVVNMQYTSGTTGFPKGVMLSYNVGNNGFWIGEIRNLQKRIGSAFRFPSFTVSGACWEPPPQ